MANHVSGDVIEYQVKLLRGNKPSRRAQAYDERRQVTAEAMAAAGEEEEGKGTAGLTDRSKRRRVSGLAWVYVPTDAQTGAIQSGSKEATEIANHVRMIQGRSHKRVVANLQQQIDTLNGKLEQSKERIDYLREETAELLPQAKKAKSLAARKDTLTQKLAGKDEELKEKKREVNMANQDRREQAKRARSAELAVERTEGKLEAVKANMEDAGERAKEKWQEKVDKEKKMKNEARQRAREAELRNEGLEASSGNEEAYKDKIAELERKVSILQFQNFEKDCLLAEKDREMDEERQRHEREMKQERERHEEDP